jgi:hypothetical protein
MKTCLRTFTIFVALLGGLRAGAFPEMVRHGYLSCTACHVNANGGGILTPFGRALSGDVLSMWNSEGESRFLYGVTPPEWLNLGGDLRGVQIYQKNSAFTKGRFILMQADVEAAAQLEKWSLVATLGVQQVPDKGMDPFELLSRRFYLSYRPAPQWIFQAGKFNQAFGINTPDHVITTKRGLGWDEGTETLNLQGVLLNKHFDTFLTLNFGRPDDSSLDREKGIALRGRYYAGRRARVGASYFYGGNSQYSRHVYGPFAEIAFAKEIVLLLETDFQNKNPLNLSPQWGAASYAKLDYEWLQGLHTYLTQEYSKLDFKDPNSLNFSFGIGAQYFPRPHLEINASWQKRKKISVSNDFEDFAWLMLHFYL